MQPVAAATLRVGTSAIMLWFGITQLIDPTTFLAYAPTWLPLAPTTTMFINAVFETVLGTALLLGAYTRVTAALLAAHMAFITVSVGYNPIGVRDAGLLVALTATAINGDDPYTLQQWIAS